LTANLQKVINQAGDSEEGGGASEEKREMEELRGLLPDLKEKVEDAQESLKSAAAAAMKPVEEVLVSECGEVEFRALWRSLDGNGS